MRGGEHLHLIIANDDSGIDASFRETIGKLRDC